MSSSYVTTNVRLPKQMLKMLKIKAAREDKSVAQLVREAIERTFFKPKKQPSEKNYKKDTFLKVIGICDTGIKDGSVHHDRDIYGGD